MATADPSLTALADDPLTTAAMALPTLLTALGGRPTHRDASL
ncbi:hypothetical protein [Streptomyces sp. NPDC017993]